MLYKDARYSPLPASFHSGITYVRMDFLDNLENSLKNLESREERSPVDHQRRESDRARVLAEAPWAAQLKSSSYTSKLFEEAATTGHRLRTKIYMAWFETTLRLEAKGRVLELRPTAEGIAATYTRPNGEAATEAVDLSGDPQQLLQDWLG